MITVTHDPETDWCACTPEGGERCDYRLLADAVIARLNPRDGDEAEVSLCIQAVERVAAYVTSLPCTCKSGPYDGPCDRCAVLGQWHKEGVSR
jgi:hypothetical protein